MIGALAKMLLPSDEKQIVDAASSFLSSNGGDALDMGAIIDQIKGDIPQTGWIRTITSIVRQASGTEHWPIFVKVVLDSVAAKGYNVPAIASLLNRIASHLGVATSLEEELHLQVADALTGIANLSKGSNFAPVIGAVVTCPQCKFAHLI